MTGTAPDASRHGDLVERIRLGHERLMSRLAVMHAADFVAIGVSMPQAKVLYLVVAAGEIHMSALAARLGVTLSTVSGLVDRLVEAGLAARHDDPADRRQVVVTPTASGIALIERFRELNDHALLGLLDALADDELETVAQGLELLERAADRAAAHVPAPTSGAPAASEPTPPSGPPVTPDLAATTATPATEVRS